MTIIAERTKDTVFLAALMLALLSTGAPLSQALRGATKDRTKVAEEARERGDNFLRYLGWQRCRKEISQIGGTDQGCPGRAIITDFSSKNATSPASNVWNLTQESGAPWCGKAENGSISIKFSLPIELDHVEIRPALKDAKGRPAAAPVRATLAWDSGLTDIDLTGGPIAATATLGALTNELRLEKVVPGKGTKEFCLAGLKVFGKAKAGPPEAGLLGQNASVPRGAPRAVDLPTKPPRDQTSASPQGGLGAPSPATSGAATASAGGGMVRIAGGSFEMGTDTPNEWPVRPVEVVSFEMDRTEVTVAAYAACVKASGCSPASAAAVWQGITEKDRSFWSKGCNAVRKGVETHPINCVDWEQARAFCAWAGKRLPTEAEWEFAARGGAEQRVYPWGNDPPEASRLNACGPECVTAASEGGYAWTAMYQPEDTFAFTAPVGSFPSGQTRDGLLDMVGNVKEWVADWYCDPGGSSDCPTTHRALRGGGWATSDRSNIRSPRREREIPTNKGSVIGFRCARTL